MSKQQQQQLMLQLKDFQFFVSSHFDASKVNIKILCLCYDEFFYSCNVW